MNKMNIRKIVLKKQKK